jgi:glycosyltransferase involved in cell wall biosynthesis
MRLAVVTGSTSRRAGGLFVSVRRLVQQLHAMGVHVVVHSIYDDFSGVDANLWNPVATRALTSRGPGSLGFAPDLRNALENFQPEVIQIHGLWKLISLSAMNAARRSACPYIIHTHGMLDPWALQNSRWKKKLVSWLYQREHLRRAACIRALNARELDSIRSFGIRNPVATIPNGIDVPPSEESPASIDRHPELPVQRRTFRTLLFLGRIHPKKGLAQLIEGWKVSGVSRQGWILRIAGWDDGGHEQALRRRIRCLGVEESVFWSGPLFGTAKEAALRSSSAFVLASFSEGLPLAILEAWAYGKPVLMTPQCNLPEGFAAQAALSIDPKPHSIAEGIRRIVGMPTEELAAMGRRGRHLVEEKFAWPQIATDMKAVYDWILGHGPRPACVSD